MSSLYDAAIADTVNAVGKWKDSDMKLRVRFGALLDVFVFSRLALAAKDGGMDVSDGPEIEVHSPPNKDGYM